MSDLIFRAILFAAALAAIASCTDDDEGSVFISIPSSQSGISFENVIEPQDSFNILEYMYFYNGAGISCGDVNRDGLQDLFFTSNQGSCKLYLNEGDLRFRDITETSGLQSDFWATGTAMVDVNQDGWLDIYVCAAGHPEGQKRANRLFINQGDMTFVEQAAEYGLADTSHSTQATFFDYDLDGDLDMYLLNHMHQFSGPNDPLPKRVKGESPNTDKLYVNEWSDELGHPVFRDKSAAAGITIEGFGLGVTSADVNLDGWPDLYVSNDFVSNDILYINNGDGTFTNRIAEYISAQTHNGMGNDIADINNDGLPEIFVSDMLPPGNRRRKLMAMNTGYDLFDIALNMGYQPQYPRNTLQLHNGFDSSGDMLPFSEIGQLAGVHATDWSWSTLFADYDNDGLKDLYITNGHLKDLTDLDFIVYRQQRTQFTTKETADSLYLALLDQMPGVSLPNTFFRNTGTLQFENVTEQWHEKENTFSNGAIYEDLDNDGDLDIVVNCVNREALILENKTNDDQATGYLQVELTGPEQNPRGRGAKLWLYANTGTQYAEQFNERGYMSSHSGVVHFGLPPGSQPDSIVVLWPEGRSQTINAPPSNERLTIDWSKATDHDNDVERQTYEPLFALDSSFSWKDTDPAYPDHKHTALIPRSYSTQGPGAAAGDINGDGLDDIVIGASFGQQTVLALQQSDGSFVFSHIPNTESYDDTGILLIDIDDDGDLDIYAASGGSDHRANMNDRLYLNDGMADFTPVRQFENGSSSCAVASDFDNDGDLDVFVGGRLLVDYYGAKPSSQLYINQGAMLNKAPDEVNALFDSLGMVTSALWTDFDNDSDPDLIVVGEWMGIVVFRNNAGQLERDRRVTGLDAMDGWWNSIAGGDFDNDGDIDYILGNYGLNSDYWASAEYPIRLHAGYLDDNRSWDILITRPVRSDAGEIDVVPVHYRNQLLEQFNPLKKVFTSFELYANADESDLFNSGMLSARETMECRTLASVYLENLQNDSFRATPLPELTQIAPIHGIEVLDVDDDEYLDAVLTMNFYGNDVFRGRADASIGVCLMGRPEGGFDAILPAQSGYFVDGDARGLISYDRVDKARMLLALRNNASALAYEVKNSQSRGRAVPGSRRHIQELGLANGSVRKIEFYYGSGYLSQSAGAILIPSGASLNNYDHDLQ